MEQHLEQQHHFLQLRRWLIGLIIGLVIMSVLALCSIMFNWTWTGFQGNTLWDWLKLLLLPVALSAAPLWANTRQQWGTSWLVAIIAALAVLLFFVIGGYALNWTWTGFQGNTLWDWLGLLLLPLMLTVVTVQLRSHQDRLRIAELQKQLAEQLLQNAGQQPSQ
jgi:putative effector of murein hydrolase LrgA (UPF0299 family)